MKKLTLFLTALAALSVNTLRAEQVSLTRTEAFELHAALSALAPGLSPENTFAAADAIAALDPAAKSFRTAYQKLLQLQQGANTPELMGKFREEDAKFAAAAESKLTFDLPLVPISKEEVKAASISANTLAVIRRLLKPAPKP